MSRSFPWRRHLSDAVCWHQAEAQNATIFILREMGPTGFLLKEEGENKNVKVYLGDPHSCTCSVFKKEKDLCKHILWVLLKRFRVPKDNPISWQLGLVEREINEVLHFQLCQRRQKKAVPKTGVTVGDGRQVTQQRDIAKDDVCPICQEELLLKHLPVTYCKYSCGNSIHIRCMKIWAEHQQGLGKEDIKCPICREDFGPLNQLKAEWRNATGETRGSVVRMDRHLGTCCRSCHIAPIEGKCYRCSHCVDYYLCQLCLNTPIHTQHSFEFRHKRNQRWRAVERSFGVSLPLAVTQDLMNRDISSTDYDLLLQLDSDTAQQPSHITESLIDKLQTEMVRNTGTMLAPGVQCRVCLRGYQVGEIVVKLPCKHKYHKECIKNWLLHSHPTCPIDGLVVNLRQNQPVRTQPRSGTSQSETRTAQNETMLEIPGIGIATRPRGGSLQESRGVLRQIPPRHIPPAHRPPSSMQIAGLPLADTVGLSPTESPGQDLSNRALPGGNLSNRVLPGADLSDHTLPGTLLLRKTEQHQEWIGQQLSMLEQSERGERLGPTELRPVQDGTQIVQADEQKLSQVISLLRMNGSSAPSRIENKPPVPGRIIHRNMNQLLHHNRGMSVSPQQHHLSQVQRNNLVNGLQTFQDIYLGHNPRLNPPENELLSPVSRERWRPNLFTGSRKKKHVVPDRTVDMALEGNQIDTLTMRDILRD